MTGPSLPVGALHEPARYTAPDAPIATTIVPPPPPVWSIWQRVAFRLVFSYLALYLTIEVPGFLGILGPGVDAPPPDPLWSRAVPWVGAHVLHLADPMSVSPNGSGDTTYYYVMLFCFVTLAIVSTIVWSIFDRRRTNYVRLHHYLRVVIRYDLAFEMLSYGGIKIIKAQFPFPYLDRLLQPYGQSSPMGLLWTMMGLSTAYNLFAGVAEAAGGALLLWRRTTTLGALLVMAAMANVVMLNFTFDVPVKLFSAHLFLMGLFLAAPQLGRVSRALLGRAVSAEPVVPHANDPVRHWGGLALKTAIIVNAVGSSWLFGWRTAHQYGDLSPAPPLYGIWEVASFARNGQELPPLLTDSTRWRYLVVDRTDRISVHTMPAVRQRYRPAVDTTAHRLALTLNGDTTKTMAFTYTTPDTNRLELAGAVGMDTLRIALRRIGPHGFLLVDRGFHWINEQPFNR